MDSRPPPFFHAPPAPPPPFAHPQQSQEHERFPDAPRTMPHAGQAPQSAAAPPGYAYGNTPVQLPVQQDPFRNRSNDPFMPSPSSAGQRRSSHGGPPSEHRQHRSMSSLGHIPREAAQWTTGNNITTAPPTYSQSSKSSHTSPRRSPVHSAASDQPFTYEHARRNSVNASTRPPHYYQTGPSGPPPPTLGAFRPMSGSSHSESSSNYASQRLPSTRELPGLSSSSRQGSGMSISSMLDSNAPPPRASQPPSHMRPPSPRRPPSNNSHREYQGQWGRVDTPEKPQRGPADSLNYPSSTSSPRHYQPGPRESPEYSRSHSANFHAHPTPPRQPHHQGSPRASLDARAPLGHPSQPTQYGAPPPPFSDPRESPSKSRAAPLPQPPPPSSYTYGTASRNSNPHHMEQPHVYDKPPPISGPPSSQSYAPQYHQEQHGPDDNNLLRRNLLGQEPIRDDARREHPRKEEQTGQMRTGYRGQYYNQPPSAQNSEPPRSHPLPHESDRRQEMPNHEPVHVYGRPNFDPHRREEHVVAGPEPKYSIEPLSRRASGEDGHPSRPFLGIAPDTNKRGRASPLPQAVKGVQAQFVGPANDPNIKSEFGRIFQGLGSGLGGLGNMTPSRQSPAPQRLRDDGFVAEQDGHKMMRTGSFGNRVKKSLEGTNDDGRRSPFASGGRGAGGRKTKQHPQPVQQQRQDDDSPLTMRVQPAMTVPPLPVHAYQPPAVTGPPAIARPVLTVHSDSVLASVSQQDRRHLGTADYDVVFTTPPHASTPIYDKWGFCMQYKPSQRFSNADENCTFTIRVPHKYLVAEMREKLCADRYCFGTEIYTDDTDPLVAAMHSGWIRGSWPSEIDTSMMDLPPVPKTSAAKHLELKSPPTAGPMLPVAGMDCLITILVLPTLEKYVPSLRFGIKSRPWGDNHDGCSIMVTGVKWVEGAASSSGGPEPVTVRQQPRAKKANARSARELVDAESKRPRLEMAA